MRTLQSFLMVGTACAAFAAALAGCGSSGTTTPSGTAGAGTAGAGTAGAGTAGAGTAGAANVPGDAANGATLFVSNACNSCHGDSAEGSIGPNITGSATGGIGAWTQAQFFNAVRNGKARSGAQLCATMTPFLASMLPDQGIYDIYAYLETLTNDTVNRGSAGCDTQ